MTLPIWMWILAPFFSGIAFLALLQVLLLKRHAIGRWLDVFWRKAVVLGGPVVAYVLYATFAIAQDTLQRVDPVIFAALQMTTLLPMAVAFLWISRRTLTVEVARQGAVGGLLLGLGFVGVALSLRNIGIIRAASLTGLDGIMASLLLLIVFRKAQPLATALAGIC